MPDLTPGMRQYMEVKEKHPECIVLFRMGDFYETFFEDAKTVSRELDIVLTARGKGDKRAPLAGIPYHALDSYLGKLVKRGFKVCIVEQLEDPKKAKGLVKRGVVRVITPGTVIEENILSSSSNNFIAAVCREKNIFGVSFADISTGEFMTSEVSNESALTGEIEKYSPAEIVMPMSLEHSSAALKIKEKFYVTFYDDRFFWLEKSKKTLLEHFGITHLDSFGVQDKPCSVSSSGALVSYLKETQMNTLSHISKLRLYSADSFMVIDSTTQRNLELTRNIHDSTARGTLFEVINQTVTPMGSRKLRQWLMRPLQSPDKISLRLDAVSELIEDALLREELRSVLQKFADIERIAARVIYGTANPRDLVALSRSLDAMPKIKALLKGSKAQLLKSISRTDELSGLKSLIRDAIKDEPAITVREGNIIRKGFSKELDELRETATSGRRWVSELEDKERQRTGIKSLHIKYNKVFGYFIEVSKSNLSKVPEDYIRKQTQANSERFITDELKKKEDMILGAQDRIYALEFSLFSGILKDVEKKISEIQKISSGISSLDCIAGLACCAAEGRYCRPVLDQESVIDIKGGRHAVVEKIQTGFVENDCVFNKDTLKLITGPNMAGKSTYLRQNALIVLLAHVGSYVPASYARIGIVDRIFTRVGAYDDLSMGQSTFMVEMQETANILNNASERSFVVLDEIGRGTSTYDGFCLAWAIAEHILDIGCRTLFATHYHQLNKMAEEYNGIKNYNVHVKEEENDIVFLRKIVEGGTDKSYGIHAAKLAGVPKEVISKAEQMMSVLEAEDKIMMQLEAKDAKKRGKKKLRRGFQKTLFDL